MDEIDTNLLEAWDAVVARLGRDAAAARRRAKRWQLALMTEPPLAWCVKLRASDTRLDGAWAVADDHRDLYDAGEGHDVVLYGDLVRRVTAPVYLNRPGVYHLEAAERLGMTRTGVGRWIRRGLLRVEYVRGYPHGLRGKPRPYVWSPVPLDPQAMEGERPDPVWGSLWMYLPERVPEEFDQTLRREPRVHVSRRSGEPMRLGWLWVCPSCGRRARKLYLPMRVWTVTNHLGDRGLAGLPDELRAIVERVTREATERREWERGFACQLCVKPASVGARSVDAAWNLFVSHVSGGLLYGREVARPAGVCRRRVRRVHAKSRAARARAERSAGEAEAERAGSRRPGASLEAG